MPPHEVRVIDCCDIWMAPTTHGGHGRRSCLPVSLRGAAQENTNLCNQCILHTAAFTFCCNFYILVHRQHRASLLAQRGTETHMSRSRSCFFGLHYTVNSQEAKKRAVKKPQKVVLLKRAVKRSVQLHYYVPLRVSLFGRSLKVHIINLKFALKYLKIRCYNHNKSNTASFNGCSNIAPMEVTPPQYIRRWR
jgi:hypothetical protein